MATDWESLAGEKGREVETSRLGRAFKLGKLATRVTGSAIKAYFTGRKKDREDHGALAEGALKNAQHIVRALGELKGAAMKLGQMVSSDPEIVTPEFALALATLQRKAPPMTFATLKAQIEASFDKPLDLLFRYFDPEPLGAASIGQVHRARLFDGREVAVKVQYPKMVETLESDLKNMSSLLQLGRVFTSKGKLDEVCSEIRTSILREADYAAEAQNISLFGEALSDFEGVFAPRIVPELCSKTVLTMSFVEGVQFDDALLKLSESERVMYLERYIRAFMYLFHECQLLHGDPQPGNFLLTPDGRIAVLDYGCVRRVPESISDGVLRVIIGFWHGDIHEIEAVLREMQFASSGEHWPESEDLYGYFKIFLAPIAQDQPFNMAQWPIYEQLSKYVLQHLRLKRLMPPKELLLYFRAVAGLKGLLTKMNVNINLYRIAAESCKKRGFEK